MRVIDVEQGHENWDTFRSTRPTSSDFSQVITPKQLKPSAQRFKYARGILAARLGMPDDPPLPTFEMQRGTQLESTARKYYCIENNVEVLKVGSCVPDDTKKYSCSPDGLVGRNGLLEIKCPTGNSIINVHHDMLTTGATSYGDTYWLQIQGQLMITGRDWCDLYIWHPHIKSVTLRIKPCQKTIDALKSALDIFCDELDEMESKLRSLVFSAPREMVMEAFKG